MNSIMKKKLLKKLVDIEVDNNSMEDTSICARDILNNPKYLLIIITKNNW